VRLFAAAALAAALSGSALAGDVIRLADGRALGTPQAADPPTAADFAASNLTVLEENLDGVVYRLAGVPTRQTLARDKLKSVAHEPSSVPAELTEGNALVGKGKFDDGRAKLVAAARNAAVPAWAQAEAAFRHAESYATEGNAAAAERSLATFELERSRSRYVLDARRMRARLLLDAGRDEDAKAEYEAASRAQGATEDEVLDARFMSAWTDARGALRSADAAALAAAAKTFDEMRPHGGAHPALAARCDVAKAACTGAADPIVAVVAASEDPFVLAVGHTVLADAARRRGTEKKDKDALEDAQERYLRVSLLYRDAEGAQDFVAAAQFHAGEMFVQLAPEDAAGAAEARSRARREWEELVRRSPRGEWAKRAKSALATLQ
jgi:hypothetical protein